MRILQILPELNVGGVETGTIDLAKYLVQEGHHSVVVSNGGSLVSVLERQGSVHYRHPVHRKSLWTVLQMIKRVRKIIVDEKIDIVHARSRIPAWIGYFACRKTKAAFITTCHGHYQKRIYSQVMGWPKLVIAISSVIARYMIEHYKVPSQNIRIIPRSVDLSKFVRKRQEKDPSEGPVIAVIGRITPLKGHVYFIRAMAQLVRSMPQAKIWVIGAAPKKKEMYRHDLEALVKRLGIAHHVEFLGNRDDVPDLLAKIDVVILSTVTPEAFGRVILEAQAAKVPVVATKVGGVIDIIEDERTGLLVMPKDIQAMAKAVQRVLEDGALRKTIVENAAKKLKENYTLTKMAERTLAVYEELLQSLDILIIKISAVGDVVLITASIKAIRQKFPHAKIYCLTGKESRKVLHNCPHLDGLIIYDHKGKQRGWWKLWSVGSSLRKYNFDKVIDFQNNRKSHLLGFLSMARETYGFDNKKWSFFLTHPVKNYKADVPAVPHQFRILDKLGIPYKERFNLEMRISDLDKKYAKSLLDAEWLGNAKNIIGINIAASEKWRTKNWPVEYIAELCDRLAGDNMRVIITGVRADVPKVGQLMRLTKSKPANLVGKTDIAQLAAVINRCKVYVTPDSAPLHIAAAVQTPVLALFGPTDSARHSPPAKKITILERQLECSPCYSSRCRVGTHACMKEITPDAVYKEIKALMGEPA